MLSLLKTYAFFWISSHALLISRDTDHHKCYELELENCFREAFLSAIHPPILQKRDTFRPHNETALRSATQQTQVCHDVKKFSSCFIHPGCSDQQAANVASVQYHMVFGKKLPMNVFLAYRGYGRELCDHECSIDVIQNCKKKMTDEEKREEQSYTLELLTIIGHILPNRDTSIACGRFNHVLVKLLRLRKMHCGEVAKCTCGESSVQQGIDGCNLGCENLLYSNLDILIENNGTLYLNNFYVIVSCYIFFLFGI